MNPNKTNKDINRALEALNEELKFYNKILFGISSTEIHDRIGTYYTLKALRDMLPITLESYGNFKIYVGNEGLDNVNKHLGTGELYFNSLSRAIDVACYLGITEIRVISDIVIENTIDLSGKDVYIVGDYDPSLTGSTFTKRNIYIDALSGFKLGFNSGAEFENIRFRNRLANINSVFSASNHKYNNAKVRLIDSDFIGVRAEIANLNIINFGDTDAVTSGEFGGVFAFDFSNVDLYVKDSSRIIFEATTWSGDNLLFMFTMDSSSSILSGLDGSSLGASQIVDPYIKHTSTITTSSGTVNPHMNVLTNDKTFLAL